MRRILSGLILIFCLSCTREKPAEVAVEKPQEAAGVAYSIEIVPINVTRNAQIYLVPQGFALSDGTVEWLVNGTAVTAPAPDRFDARATKKDDKVQARVVIQGQELLSNVVQIQNSLPVISRIKFMPEVFKPGDTLRVDAEGSDADGDEVTLEYEWTRNGNPAGNGPQMSGQVKKGDMIDVKITPYDGEAYGQPATLHREITNLPPVIEDHRTHHFDGTLYTYQIRATDPDQDPLTYALKSAPEGMTVDSSTGLVRWTVPASFNGKASFVVSVTDGHGGEATQNLFVEIKSA